MTEIDRMSRLVEDLVLLAQAGDETFLRLEPIDLEDFLRGTVDGLRPTAQRRLVMENDAPAVVLDADPDRLAQALRNVLRNAVVHTGPGGLVRLTATRCDGAVRLTVDDDGPGIAPGGTRARVRPPRAPGHGTRPRPRWGGARPGDRSHDRQRARGRCLDRPLAQRRSTFHHPLAAGAQGAPGSMNGREPLGQWRCRTGARGRR
jgi:hypothetical protein